ncbi:MAG: hypothetical protein RMK91_01410 [Pseudanabaenaceae cyanobacterium SKYGB_i_bin29]|nr:hypothetical protein [Pseudanabaenaceae cyanobacterium SKYG29]MDW8420506.1 hypothetical protein [Pseudanabaenaceae cyanobacterium SKYGB_i_bin29]
MGRSRTQAEFFYLDRKSRRLRRLPSTDLPICSFFLPLVVLLWNYYAQQNLVPLAPWQSLESFSFLY